MKNIIKLLLLSLSLFSCDNNDDVTEAPQDQKQLYFSTEGMKEFVIEIPFLGTVRQFEITVDAQFYFDVNTKNMELVLKENESSVDSILEFYGNVPLTEVTQDPTSYNYSMKIDKGVEGSWKESVIVGNSCIDRDNGVEKVEENIEVSDLLQYEADSSLFYINLWDVVELLEEVDNDLLNPSDRLTIDLDYSLFPPFKIYQNRNVISLNRCE